MGNATSLYGFADGLRRQVIITGVGHTMMYSRRCGVLPVLAAAMLCGSSLAVSAAENRAVPVPPHFSVNETPTDPLDQQIDRAIDISRRRYLTAGVHSPWQIMHGLLALRQSYVLKLNGEKINALNWIAAGAQFEGEYWFQKTEYGGRAHPYNRPYAFQGHACQFLAILSMSNLPATYQFHVANKQTITIADMVRNAQMEVNTEDEITWTLWALAHYLPPDARWVNNRGEQWSIERLVRIQTDEPDWNAACGASHALFALSYARNRYLQTGQRLRGTWRRADRNIERHISLARRYQNGDGTFSTNYFQGPKFSRDFDTRLSTSGHTLEWLMVALPRERLGEDWVRQGIEAISRELIENRRRSAKCGSLYHALDALIIYRERTRPSTAALTHTTRPVISTRRPTASKPTFSKPTVRPREPIVQFPKPAVDHHKPVVKFPRPVPDIRKPVVAIKPQVAH